MMKKILFLFFSFFIALYAQAQDTLQLGISVEKRVIDSDTFVYNLSNSKLHTHDCEWAEKCTKNCIFLSKDEIKDLFYIPCLVCGGNIFENTEEE